MRTLRPSLARETPDAGQRAARLLAISVVPNMVVAGYRALAGEFDPLPVMRRMAAAGAHLALPAVCDGALEFRGWTLGDPLTPDAIGLAAPAEGSPVVRPDLILAPLLAFDHRGGRLGQGGGHFDRAIADLRSRGPLTVVGCAFAGQEVDLVPLEAHDARLDAILTERGYREIV